MSEQRLSVAWSAGRKRDGSGKEDEAGTGAEIPGLRPRGKTEMCRSIAVCEAGE